MSSSLTNRTLVLIGMIAAALLALGFYYDIVYFDYSYIVFPVILFVFGLAVGWINVKETAESLSFLVTVVSFLLLAWGAEFAELLFWPIPEYIISFLVGAGLVAGLKQLFTQGK